ncbi:MAG: hypothetical protein DHS20C03_02690 [Minwuia thermotolerans]|nr:MAG: hypothetical protein DHS20C03_02690 [Minwuia thermotolerans]
MRQAGYRSIPISLPERSGYRQAQNQGLALSETSFTSLNERARRVVEEINGELLASQKGEL